jgi:hypothetical protein
MAESLVDASFVEYERARAALSRWAGPEAAA